LLAVFGMGFAALFCLVGVFTYVNFYLAAPPFRLNSAQLGSVFAVYLLGVIVTPLAGRFLDHYCVRRTALLAFGFAVVGLSRSSAAGLYVTLYYVGGSWVPS
jgi:MFS transporter, YNFM family, putative membrane transport protein